MPVPESQAEGAQNIEWSEALHSWIFRARIFLKRYWWIFLLTVAGGVGLQAYKQYQSKPVYQSSAQLTLRGRIVISQGASYVDEYSNFYATTEYLLTSSEVAKRAQAIVQAQYPQEFPSPPGVAINAAQVNNANVIGLTAMGGDALYTQYYLNAVIKAFFDYRKEQRDQSISSAMDETTSKMLDYTEKISDQEKQINDFLKSHNMVSVDEQSKSAGDEEAQLEGKLAAVQTQLRLLKSANFDDYIAGNNVEDVDEWLLGPDGVVPTDPNYQQAKQELRERKAEMESFADVLRPSHPKMLALNAQIMTLQNSLQVLRRQIVSLLDEHRSALEAEMAHLTDDVKDAQDRALKFSKLEAEYDEMHSQLDSYQKTQDMLANNKTSITLDQGVDQELLSVLEWASDASQVPVNPTKQIGVGAFTGLVAGAALIFMLGLVDGRVMSVEDVTQRFDEQMLGIIPMQRRVSGQVELLKSNDQRLMFAESCRNIRSSLLYMDHLGQRPRMIVITSSIPGEGKSTISSNLAITLGFASSRTLLVDADLRRGQLWKRFGLKNDLGLAEHIQDGVPIEQVIQPTSFENLDVITSGQYPAHPGELLMNERFRETMLFLKKKYDFVVFDSPPIMATDDAASFATRTDAVIFVVRAGHTRLRQIRASLESLRRRGVRIYGLVVNFIDHREPGYYSYKYYDYYSYRAPEGNKPTARTPES
jgi:capsular exopolysaccharide synthesis family protein